MSAELKIITILLYVATIMGIVIYVGRGNKTFRDFAIGGGKIPWYIMAGTLFSTFCGGATMVAYVGNFYLEGMIWIWIPIQVTLVGVIYCFVYKRIFNLRQVSTADVISMRYGEQTRLMSSLVVMLAEVGMVAAMMSTFGTMVNTYVGLSKGVALILGMVLFAGSAALGGYKGVAITDAIQGVIIFIGLTIGAFTFTNAAGGIGAIAAAAGPDKMNPFSTANLPLITIFGTFISSFGMHMALQSGYVSRINSVATLEDAKKGIRTYTLFITIAFAVFVPIIGLSANVLLADGATGDSVIGTLLNRYLSPGLATIYVAAIVSAVLTTANSSLLSASVCLTNDVYKGIVRKNATDKEQLVISKIFIVIIVLIAYLVTQFFATIISMMFVVYTINALIAIPLFAGLYSKKPGSTAAFLSLGMGIVAVLGWLLLDNPYGIHVAVIGIPVAIIGLVIGTIFGKKPSEEQVGVVNLASIDETLSTN